MKLRDLVAGFLCEYLPRDRGASARTIETYRYALGLWLEDLGRQFRTRRPSRLRLEQLDPKNVLNFLSRLEKERRNCVSTRNARLAALKSLFRYAALMDPRCAAISERVLTIPKKLGRGRSGEPLSREEIRGMIEAVPVTSPLGFRDRVLIQFIYNTGARASEVSELQPSQLALEGSNPHVRIHGKGGRWRMTPLLGSTASKLQDLLKRQNARPASGVEQRVFLNRAGRPLTRQGVRRIVLRCAQAAAQRVPSLRGKRVTTHWLRYTTAVEMYRCGVDESTLQWWLGHVYLDTTQGYTRRAEIDTHAALDNFRQAVDFVGGVHPERPVPPGSVQRLLRSL